MSITRTVVKEPIWLVWALHDNGLVSLRLIASTQNFAAVRRKYLEFHEGVVRAWIEKTLTNHLFAEGEFEQMMYGQQIKTPLKEEASDDIPD